MKTSIKRLCILVLALGMFAPVYGQKKEGGKKKKLNLRLGDKLGKLAGKMMTSGTTDLSEASLIIHYTNGIYTHEASLSADSFMPKGWQEGDDMVGLQFTKMDGLGMLNIEGKVALDGEIMESQGMGFYANIVENDPQSVSISTTTGQSAQFDIYDIADIKIKSVNGQTENIVVDIGEDLELELENGDSADGTMVKVALLTKVVGAKAFNVFAEFSSRDKVLIPAESFSNPEISGSVKGVGNFQQGANYLMVERYYYKDVDKQTLGAAEFWAHAYSSIPVTVTGKQKESVYGALKIKGESNFDAGEIKYQMSKPNAKIGMPFSEGSQFGLASLRVRGTLFHQESSTTESTSGNIKTITTTTTTYDFPQLPDAFWEQLMENIYTDVQEIFSSEFGISFVPVESVTGSQYYAEFYEVEEENTNVKIKKSYKNTQNIFPEKLGDIMNSISTNLTHDKPEVNLMKDAKVDGLLTMTVDLQIAADNNDKIILVPRMSFNIMGLEEKYTFGITSYGQGGLNASDGVPFSESEFQNINALNRIVRKDDLMKAFRQGLKALQSLSLIHI